MSEREQRFLLGRLPEGEQEAFEREALADDGRFEAVLAAEDELVDAYVAGRLPDEDARRFEALFLGVPARRERVEFARALRRLVQAQPGVGPSRRPAWPWWLPVAASLAAVAVGGWAVLRVQGLSQALSRAHDERQDLGRQLTEARSRAGALSAELEAAREGTGGIASWTVEPGREREAGAPPARVVPAGTQWVRLRLRAGGIPAGTRVRVVLETAEGRRLAVQEGLRPRPAAGGPAAVDAIFPASLFAPGAYVITLGGAPPPDEAFESYALIVAGPVNEP